MPQIAMVSAGMWMESSRSWMLAGSLTLVAYGFTVNAPRSVDFGRLMGLYIAVFFVVSQLVNLLAFGGRSSPAQTFR